MLITIQKVKYYLDIEQIDTSEDVLIEDLIAQATDSIETYCNRKFDKKIYTEEVRGYNTLYPKNTPVLDVLELVDEDEEAIECRFTENKIIIKRKENIGLTGKSRPIEPIIKSYTVTYDGGYAVLPAGLVKVATEMVVIAYNEIKNEILHVKSRTEGSVNQSFIDKAIIQPHHKEILDTYKIINI